ncbi:MAG: prolyl oligopeptidase family serine peptidase [Pseudomonadota bacterium]
MAKLSRGVLLSSLVCAAFSVPVAHASNAEERSPFSVDDYFKIQRVEELALSSDGALFAYVVTSPSLEENKTARLVYVSTTEPNAKPMLVNAIQSARSFSWIPGTHELAFLSSDGDVQQVYSINIPNGVMRQYTHSNESVVSFKFSPDGATLAWLTQHSADFKQPGLYNQLLSGEKGVVIDYENTVVYQFIDAEWPIRSAIPVKTLWIAQDEASPFQVETADQVESFYWSSDGKKLSITYRANDTRQGVSFSRYTNLGIFDVTTRAFQVLARARMPSETEKALYYKGGEWIPGADTVIVRRIIEETSRNKDTVWALVETSELANLEDPVLQWNETEIYGGDREPAFMPTGGGPIYSNKTVNARRSLYEVTASGHEQADIVRDVTGSVSLVRFSSSFEKAVFVNEALSRPPEIFVWRKGHHIEQLSYLNREIANKRLPHAKEIVWQSKDGVTVRGWLLTPSATQSERRPLPLITFVHGGPGNPFPDKFAHYVKGYGGGIWPYPFNIYALNGMAVFIPNYRGTRTFGDEFDEPESLDGEPVDDIITGIEYLIELGIADSERLAISGFSHGAWLAPLVMTRTKMFRAASFAEGPQNRIINYNFMPGFLQREIIDVQSGVSLYDDPQRYIDTSPDLHFAGLDTAILFEAGAKFAAIPMMGSPKAARRAGLPTEFVVYPKTSHTIKNLRLQKESAERNLDWFRFWLLNEEDKDPAKTGQYARWSKMRIMQN